jgi:hypothetical protein
VKARTFRVVLPKPKPKKKRIAERRAPDDQLTRRPEPETVER